MKDKKWKQNATNNGTAYFYCEIELQNKKLQSRSNQVQNFYHQIKPQFEKMFKKYERDGTSLNINKARSGRRITTRTWENTEIVQQALEKNQGWISARRNELAISTSLFCWIIKTDLRWNPCKMIRHHNLKYGNCERCSHFRQWFLQQCNNRRFLANFAIDDEARFALNNHNVQIYEPANQPQNFQ